MFDFEIAYVLYKLSRILSIFENKDNLVDEEIVDENKDMKYQAKAYYKAAVAIDAYGSYVSELKSQNRLKEIDGVGEKIKKIIIEVIETGICKQLKDLENKYKINDYSLILSDLNEKVVKKLFDNNITCFDRLISFLKSDTISNSFSFNEIVKLNQFVCDFEKVKDRYLFSYAYCLGQELVNYINNEGEIAQIELMWQDKVSEISVLLLEEYANKVCKLIQDNPRYYDIKKERNSILCLTKFGIPIKIRLVKSFHNKNTYTRVLRGDLHMHTNCSDGKHSIKEMVQHAKKLGREYIGITDHTRSLHLYAGYGLSELEAYYQVCNIHKLKNEGINVLAGIEVEILEDGSLEYSDEILSQFDYVIAAIHTYLDQPYQELYKRIDKALSNPYVNIFAHPTSRLLGRIGTLFSERQPYSVPAEEIITICKKHNIIVEFNCFPERFDLGVEYFNQIIDNDLMMSVGTDAHSVAHLTCLEYAEIAIQAVPQIVPHIINTLSYEEILKVFSNQRKEHNAMMKNFIPHNFNYFFKNNSNIIKGSNCVIGIDLTGSEQKPSGWAVLHGNYVETDMIKTDDDLIKASLKFNPDIVSIDAPLSYPKGHYCAMALAKSTSKKKLIDDLMDSDGDITQAKVKLEKVLLPPFVAGDFSDEIYDKLVREYEQMHQLCIKNECICNTFDKARSCEHTLRPLGGVYPSLVPNMVKLTARGITLAEKFRKLGVQVIESYPGAAQDVLQIPRKQNGIGRLIYSYEAFGFLGDYTSKESIKHDELDAIMSALVGYFFLDNNYISLGTPQENYLIVPNVTEKPRNPKILGLTGFIGSGKTTFSEYLKFKHGFKTLSYSSIICKLYHCDYDREKLQTLGAEISKDPLRQKQLTEEIINEIEKSPNYNYVIDGLRHHLDYETLEQRFGDRFTLISIETRFRNSYKRYNSRKNTNLSENEFKAIYNAPSENDIYLLNFNPKVIRINNDTTYKKFFANIESLLKEILCQ